MRAVTAAFLAAVQQSHEVATLVEILRDNVVIATLEVTSGTVTLDGPAASRGRVEVGPSLRKASPTRSQKPAQAEQPRLRRTLHSGIEPTLRLRAVSLRRS